ncbi:MAG: efflux RND transporter periplasmic adaptor subunit [Deferribacterales bacterium]
MKNKTETNDINSVLATGNKGGKRWRRTIIILACVLAALVVILIVRGRGDKGGAPQFNTVEAVQGDIRVEVSATGKLEPTNEVSVGTELSGTIKEVFADYNSVVKKGELLARIDTTKLQAQVTQYRAALESARANVLQTQATEKETGIKLDQLKTLFKLTDGQSPSKTEIDAAEAAYDRAVANTASARASVAQAQATLDALLTDLAKAEIRSPVNGIVLSREVEAGQTVAASYSTPELFTIAEDLKKMELHVDVDEADIGQVREGQKASFTVDAYPDRIFDGVITQARYGSQTVDNVVTYETVIQVDNSDMLLRPGMTATADITVKHLKNVVKVPTAALRYSPPAVTDESKQSFISKLMPRPPRMRSSKPAEVSDKETVTVWALENGMPEPYQVKLGDSDGSYRQAVSGDVKPGMRLITGTAGNGK